MTNKKENTPKKGFTFVSMKLRDLTNATTAIATIRRIKTEKVNAEDKSFKESTILLKHKLAIGWASEEAWQELIKFERDKAETAEKYKEEINRGTEEKPRLVSEVVQGSKKEAELNKEISDALDQEVTFQTKIIKFSDFEEMGFDAQMDADMLMHLQFMLDFDK